MRPLVITLNDITQDELRVLDKVNLILEQLPDGLSCHAVCRILVHFVDARCVDGRFFNPGWRHSWLELPSGNVLDAYPWCCSNAFIAYRPHHHASCSPWWKMYKEEKLALEPVDLEIDQIIKQVKLP